MKYNTINGNAIDMGNVKIVNTSYNASAKSGILGTYSIRNIATYDLIDRTSKKKVASATLEMDVQGNTLFDYSEGVANFTANTRDDQVFEVDMVLGSEEEAKNFVSKLTYIFDRPEWMIEEMLESATSMWSNQIDDQFKK